jgi:hypothetical protein
MITFPVIIIAPLARLQFIRELTIGGLKDDPEAPFSLWFRHNLR